MLFRSVHLDVSEQDVRDGLAGVWAYNAMSLQTPVRPGDHPALLHIRVDNLPACEALLKKNGVTFLKPDAGRVLVPPSEAAHLTIEFAER